LATHLAKLSPYMKKSVLTEAIDIWNQKHKCKLCGDTSNAGLWLKMEAFALKDLLMKKIKKAHNTLRYSKETGRPAGSNMGNVVRALLQPGSGSRESSLESGGTERSTMAPTPNKTSWVDKQRRLLRRRSSEHDEVALVAMQRMSGEGKPTTTP